MEGIVLGGTKQLEFLQDDINRRNVERGNPNQGNGVLDEIGGNVIGTEQLQLRVKRGNGGPRYRGTCSKSRFGGRDTPDARTTSHGSPVSTFPQLVMLHLTNCPDVSPHSKHRIGRRSAVFGLFLTPPRGSDIALDCSPMQSTAGSTNCTSVRSSALGDRKIGLISVIIWEWSVE